jgi:hypothetical protein
MQVSPDGKFIAFGCESYLIVLDAESMREVFKDPTMSVNRVRFSPSGKYLAVAGTNNFRENSVVALYESDGFKRVPEVALYPGADSKRKTVVVDIVFRPDEKSLLYVYHEYWKRNPNSSATKNYYQRPITTCSEIEIPSGKEIQHRLPGRIRDNVAESFKFSPDASKLVYVLRFEQRSNARSKAMSYSGQRNISLWDTLTWDESIVTQEDPKYKVSEVFTESIDLDKIYFEYEYDHHFYNVNLPSTPTEEVFSELNIKNLISRDIVSTDVGGNIPGFKWSTITKASISPDRKKAALLGMTQTLHRKPDDYRRKAKHKFFIVIVDLEGNANIRFKRYMLDKNFKGEATRNIFWLNENCLVVSTQSKLLFINPYDWKVTRYGI